MNTYPLKYPPGSNWLYLKIYGGPQGLEEWLTRPFRDLLSAWKQLTLVKQFHFIHYIDPEYHLRLRFLLFDPVNAGVLMNQIQVSCREMLDEDLIWKIEVGTYEPEYDRYGPERMALVESWFEIDSYYWLDEITRRTEKGDQEIWKSAIHSVDVFLGDFGATLDEKIIVINRLKESSVSLFGLSSNMKGQLDEKYRKLYENLSPLIDTGNSGPDPFLAMRSAVSQPIILEIRKTCSDNSILFGSTLLPDLIHMSLNRAFRTRHRLQELVVCDFMGRYYESVRAREKHRRQET